MTSKDLINYLLELDPSGTLEVSVGKTPIWTVEKLPSYYDGCLKKLVIDTETDFYNIIGMEIIDKGEHICLTTASMEDVIHDNADIPISLCIAESRKEWYENQINYLRKESRDFEEAMNEAKIIQEIPPQ
jgi:hypothetical protein